MVYNSLKSTYEGESMMKRYLSILLALVLCLMPFSTAFASGHDYTILNGAHIQRRGSKGSDVSRIQQRLSNLGYLTARVDGSYGAKTEQAVRAFQQKNGITPSGVATLLTQAVLFGSDALNAWNNSSRPNTGTGNYDVYNADMRSWGSGLDISFDFVNRDSQDVEAICIYYWLDTGGGRLVTIQGWNFWQQWYYGMDIPSGGRKSVSLSLYPKDSELRKAHVVKAIVGEIAYTNGSVVVSMNAAKQPYENASYILGGWD